MISLKFMMRFDSCERTEGNQLKVQHSAMLRDTNGKKQNQIEIIFRATRLFVCSVYTHNGEEIAH